MEKKLTQNYHLRVTDYNLYDHITAYCILDLLQDVAGKHCDSYAMSYEELINQNMAWVLVRTSFEILKPIKLHEVLKVTTWPRNKGLVDFDRETIMQDQSGDVVIKATSKWLIINYVTRRIIPAKHINYEAPCPDPSEYIYDHDAKKVSDFDITNCSLYQYKIEYNDLDHNGHVNNARYAYMLANAIKLKENELIKSFSINYVHESHLDDIINIYYLKDNKLYLVKGICDNQIIFIAELELC